MDKIVVDAAIVRELLTYDPETGLMHWLPRDRKHFNNDRLWNSWNKRFAGKQVGNSRQGDAYCFVGIFYRPYKQHRIAWLWMTGEWPDGIIDHIDHNGMNNAWANLRTTTRQDNVKNSTRNRRNTSGITGVSFCKCDKRWMAYVGVNGRTRYLGTFLSKDEAAEARDRANVEYGYHENHGLAA